MTTDTTTQEPQPFGYVTFADDGTLDGSYFQVPPAQHVERLIRVDDEAVRDAWCIYRADVARDGLELLPPVVPPATDLNALKATAIAQAYVDVDKVVADAVGNRTEEYKDAEVAARAYKDAGYTGAVPEDVACYARSNLTNQVQSGQWAAEDIIARADAFATAKLAMRSNRMDRQKDMRVAATQADLDAAVAAWDSFIAILRAQLGL